MAGQTEIKNMALFCDFENVALGVQEAKYPKFDITKVLERLLLKGSIVVRKAYCDWDRYKGFKAAMHEAAFELIEIPHVRQSGKNSADIRMVVDALDLCYTKSHVDCFVIISGDSDFSPLVTKLRENNKLVIGVGVKKSTSDLLTAACDEFIYYDDLIREDAEKRKRSSTRKPAKPREPKEARGEDGAARKTGRGERNGRGTRETTAPTIGEAATATSLEGTPTELPEQVTVDGAEPPELRGMPSEEPAEEGGERDKRLEAIDLVLETVEAFQAERGEEERIWGSMVKQALRRRNPGFSESYYGFRNFGALLEEAERRGFVKLERDERSGGYIIRLVVDA